MMKFWSIIKSFLDDIALRYVQSMEIPPNIVMQPIVVPPSLPDDTNRMILYTLAKSCLGKDIAATQNELGCAEAISYLLMKMKVPGFGLVLGTYQLYHTLQDLPAFKAVSAPLPGDLIISPTGYSSKGSTHGHVGIVAYHGIMSNNSMNGLWEEYYNEMSWEEYYKTKLGFPIYYFRLL